MFLIIVISLINLHFGLSGSNMVSVMVNPFSFYYHILLSRLLDIITFLHFALGLSLKIPANPVLVGFQESSE